MLLFLPIMVAPRVSHAQGVIRDAEIEHTIRTYITPLLEAADIPPDDVKLTLLHEPDLNSFVARGEHIFISTGLLMRSETPDQVKGVLAHEIGHIEGGHLARLSGVLDEARDEAMVGSLFGLAIGLLAGQPGVAMAGSMKAQDIVVKHLLSFTRTQERSADQVALNLLDKTHTSARGLLQFFRIIQDEELLSPERQDPYVRTHPLTRDRIEFVEHHVETSKYSNAPIPSKLRAEQDRMVAKLKGFLNPPAQTLREFKADDPSIKARYARTIAYFRDSQLDKALPIMNGLIKQEPNDPWFQELKGQMLFENGRVAEALPYYERCVALRPDEPLLRVGLAHVEIELNQPELNKKALVNLKKAVGKDRYMPLAWQLSAIAYGRDGQIGMASLALAEQNLLTGEPRDAMGQSKKAMHLLKEGSPGWLRAQDLYDTAQRQYKKKRDEE